MSSVVSCDSLARQIDELLPQTQCTQCGYAGCLPYASAIARGDADINRCPPGGQAGIDRLADLLQRPGRALDPACGAEHDVTVAVIDESLCIGCTLCISACPVDAIVGTAKRMHTVLASACTGCDLCLPPCPTECIAMVPVEPARRWTTADAGRARDRYVARQRRLATASERQHDRLERHAVTPAAEPVDGIGTAERQRRSAAVQAAIARARARRQPSSAR